MSKPHPVHNQSTTAGVLLALGMILGGISVSTASPAIPGLGSRHPLTQQQTGDLLAGELRCIACHQAPVDSGRFQLPAAPDLSEAGSRISPEFLIRFISSPHSADATTSMPDMLATYPEAERASISRAITHYLISLAEKAFDPTPVPENPGALSKGRELFHSIGCVVCHTPDGATPEPSDVSLAHVPSKYSHQSLAEFLFNPLPVRPSGRMPDMNLTRGEAGNLAAWLLRDQAALPSALAPDPVLAEQGRSYFEKLNCAACHEVQGSPQAPPARLSFHQLKIDGGCLADNPQSAPDFRLSPEQRTALAESIRHNGTGKAITPAERISRTLTAFNCIACHRRDDSGGVSDRHDPYFTTTEPNLGEAARIPPPLTGIGDKLQPEWMHRVLFDRMAVRPYMSTRMPHFGESNLRDLPQWLADLDQRNSTITTVHFVEPEGEDRRTFRDAGRALAGNEALNCIACHNFNSKPSPQFAGIDLITAPERLNPSWFNAFLRNPSRFREGIIMPEYWPGGKATATEILDGDGDKQIAALWFYLSLGRSAPDPSGITNKPTQIAVTDEPVTYRGRSSIAGYRGIAIGFPGNINLAFDARNGALTALWTGDFINVGWSGQGSGQFSPLARPKTLPQDVAFLEGASDSPPTPWPLRPVTTREEPVDPDPLYPGNHGYRFRGYFLNESRSPVLLYSVGNIRIEDRIQPDDLSADTATRSLSRSIRFESPQASTLWFRALTGRITPDSTGHFTADGVEFSVVNEGIQSLLRPVTAEDGPDSQELLLKIPVPRGRSNLELRYEILP